VITHYQEGICWQRGVGRIFFDQSCEQLLLILLLQLKFA
jgi:hypothetical protein